MVVFHRLEATNTTATTCTSPYSPCSAPCAHPLTRRPACSKEKSQSRVVIATDAGYTRADGGNNAYICLFFARGCCPYGCAASPRPSSAPADPS